MIALADAVSQRFNRAAVGLASLLIDDNEFGDNSATVRELCVRWCAPWHLPEI